MTGNKQLLATLAFAAVILTSAIATPVVSPATAQTSDDGGVVDALFSDDSDGDSGVDVLIAAAKGKVNKYNPLAERPEQAEAPEYADNLKTTFNQNNGTIMTWVNARSTATDDYNTIRFQVSDESGNTEWLFMTADVNATTGNYTNARVMNLTEFKQTDRTVDETYKLTPYASRNANSELETFVTDYAENNTSPNRTYYAGMYGEYKGDISGGPLPGGS